MIDAKLKSISVEAGFCYHADPVNIYFYRNSRDLALKIECETIYTLNAKGFLEEIYSKFPSNLKSEKYLFRAPYLEGYDEQDDLYILRLMTICGSLIDIILEHIDKDTHEKKSYSCTVFLKPHFFLISLPDIRYAIRDLVIEKLRNDLASIKTLAESDLLASVKTQKGDNFSASVKTYVDKALVAIEESNEYNTRTSFLGIKSIASDALKTEAKDSGDKRNAIVAIETLARSSSINASKRLDSSSKTFYWDGLYAFRKLMGDPAFDARKLGHHTSDELKDPERAFLRFPDDDAFIDSLPLDCAIDAIEKLILSHANATIDAIKESTTSDADVAKDSIPSYIKPKGYSSFHEIIQDWAESCLENDVEKYYKYWEENGKGDVRECCPIQSFKYALGLLIDAFKPQLSITGAEAQPLQQPKQSAQMP